MDKIATLATLNEKQKIILNFVMNDKNTFITGFAGSGKSYLIDFICKEFNKKGFQFNRIAYTFH